MKKIKVNIIKEAFDRRVPDGIPPTEMDDTLQQEMVMHAVNEIVDLLRQIYEEEWESVDRRYIPEVERDARHIIQNFVAGFAMNLKHFKSTKAGAGIT